MAFENCMSYFLGFIGRLSKTIYTATQSDSFVIPTTWKLEGGFYGAVTVE